MPRSKEEEYEICQERGHKPGPVVTASSPPYYTCVHCGSMYRYHNPEPQLVEIRTPEGWSSDVAR